VFGAVEIALKFYSILCNFIIQLSFEYKSFYHSSIKSISNSRAHDEMMCVTYSLIAVLSLIFVLGAIRLKLLSIVCHPFKSHNI
jgi:hypothetical protein